MGDCIHIITIEFLVAVCPKTKREVLEKYVAPLNEICGQFQISKTPERMAAFIAQVCHESGGFNFVKENLNYGVKALTAVFKKYFPTESLALQYERKPEKIANLVYGNRMGNGPESSGDGYRYCGRGLIQLTGKHNYTSFAESMKMSLDDAVSYLETPTGAVASAAWFWNTNDLNSYCDRGDFIGLTKRINGGTNGLEDRQKYYKIVLSKLQG